MLIAARLREQHEQVVEVDVFPMPLPQPQPVDIVSAAPSTWLAGDHEPPAPQVAEPGAHERTEWRATAATGVWVDRLGICNVLENT